jgi:hypothetical protein
MAKTLIETPFPSTAEVARELGVSAARVRSLERMLYRDSVSDRPAGRKNAARGAKKPAPKAPRARG